MRLSAKRSGQIEVRRGKGGNSKTSVGGLIRYDIINGISQDHYEA